MLKYFNCTSLQFFKNINIIRLYLNNVQNVYFFYDIYIYVIKLLYIKKYYIIRKDRL